MPEAMVMSHVQDIICKFERGLLLYYFFLNSKNKLSGLFTNYPSFLLARIPVMLIVPVLYDVEVCGLLLWRVVLLVTGDGGGVE